LQIVIWGGVGSLCNSPGLPRALIEYNSAPPSARPQVHQTPERPERHGIDEGQMLRKKPLGWR
jgi:hypothetical protein